MNPEEEYVILGGVSIYETQGYYLSNELDKIAQSVSPSNPAEIEFHASEIFSRKTAPWNKLSREEAQGVIKAVLKVIANSSNSTYAFACAVHKKSFQGGDALNLAFEDIHIHVSSLYITEIHEVLMDVFPHSSPYVNIWEDINVNGLPTYKDLVGKLYIFFRNQGKDERLALSLDIQIRVKASGDSQAANTFCKTIQFLFDWTDKWIAENDIRDQYGERFIMPVFLYSKAHFQGAFPQ